MYDAPFPFAEPFPARSSSPSTSEPRRSGKPDSPERTAADRLYAVAAAAAGIVGAHSREALRRVLESACRRVIPFDAFFILSYDAATHAFVGFGGEDGGGDGPTDATPAAGTPGERVVLERRSLLTLRADDPAAQGAAAQGAALADAGRRPESVIRCPILSGDDVLGLLWVQSSTPGMYTKQDVEVVEAMASLAAMAFANLRLLEERQATEGALWERERRLREAQRIARLGSWTWSVAGDHVAWSDELYRIYGLEPQAFGASFEAYLDRVHPDDRAPVRKQIERALRSGKPFEFEERVVRPNGEVRVLRSSGEVTRDAEGRAVRLTGVCLDITELKSAQAALQRAHDELEARVEARTAELARRTAELAEAEQRFRAIVEASPTPLLLSRIDDGLILYANERLETLIGVEPGSLAGHRTEEFYFDPADRPHVLETARSQGYVRDLELRVRRADGSARWVSLSVQGLPFDGKPALATALVDITERKDMEEALRRSEEHFRRLTETSYDLVQLLDTEGRIVYTGPSVRRLLGYTPDEIVGRAAPDFIHPDDLERASGLIREVLSHPGRAFSLEYRVRHKDGAWRWFEAYGRTVSPTSPDEGLVANARDITERRLVQEALLLQKTLLEAQGEASIDGILVVSDDGRVLSYNQRFIEMWSLPSDVVASRSDRAALDAVLSQVVDPETFLARVLDLYAHPEERARDEIALRDGRVFDRYSAPVVSSEGVHYGRIWFFRDVTAQKRHAEELDRARRNAEEAQERASRYAQHLEFSLHELRVAQDRLVQQEKLASLGQLTAGIAHEIKNPLNFVTNFAALSRELVADLRQAHDEDDSDIEELLTDLELNAEKIEEHGLRADRIVQSMMMHARGGKAPQETTDLNALVQQALHLAYHGTRSLTPDFKVQVEFDSGNDLDSVDVVPQDISRVLLNLLSNAFDAVRDRKTVEPESFEPRVRVSTRRTGDHVEIRVADNGTGMPDAVRNRVFEPFFTTKPPGRGTGLGLSLSYDIVVQGHGGTIESESEPGRGTTFIVRVPALPNVAPPS